MRLNENIGLAKVSKDDQGVVNPTYASAIRDIEKAEKKKAETTKVQDTPKHDEKPKNPKMVKGAKKMHLDESLFEDVDTRPLQDWRYYLDGYYNRLTVDIIDADGDELSNVLAVSIDADKWLDEKGNIDSTKESELDAFVLSELSKLGYNVSNLNESLFEDTNGFEYLSAEEAVNHLLNNKGKVTILGHKGYLGCDYYSDENGNLFTYNFELGVCDRPKDYNPTEHFKNLEKDGFKFVKSDNIENTKELHINNSYKVESCNRKSKLVENKVSPIQIKFEDEFDCEKNQEAFDELENILGAEELYGGSIKKIKNVTLYQYPTIYTDGVSVRYRFVFDVLTDGDFEDYNDATGEWVNQNWIRFDTGRMGGVIDSEYIINAYYEDGEPISEPRDAYHVGAEYKTVKAIINLLYNNNYEMIDNVDDILTDNVSSGSNDLEESSIPRNARKITATPKFGGTSIQLTKDSNGWSDDKRYYDNKFLRDNHNITVDETDPNYKPNRTKKVAVLQGNYGYGWDDLVEYEPGDPELKADLKSYRENEPQASHRVIYRRVPRDLKESSDSKIEVRDAQGNVTDTFGDEGFRKGLLATDEEIVDWLKHRNGNNIVINRIADGKETVLYDYRKSIKNESVLQDLQADHEHIRKVYGQEVYDALEEYVAAGNDLGKTMYSEKEWNRFVRWAEQNKGLTIKKPNNDFIKDLKEGRKPSSPYSHFKNYQKGFNDRTLRGKFSKDFNDEAKRLGKIENRAYKDEVKDIKSQVGDDSVALHKLASERVRQHNQAGKDSFNKGWENGQTISHDDLVKHSGRELAAQHLKWSADGYNRAHGINPKQ